MYFRQENRKIFVRYAILSDIHSNLEALETALHYLEGEQVDECLFLGDLIGYGANPNECLEAIFRLGGRVVAGNHDKALMDDELLAGFSDYAREAMLWTRSHLESKWCPVLMDLPLLYVGRVYTLAHGSIDCPETFQYLFYYDDAEPSFAKLETALGFIGHTHVPQLFDQRDRTASYLPDGTYRLDRNNWYLINPGSVGQPRDRDPRLAFAIFDDATFELRLMRLSYDNRRTARKIREAGLPDYLARRLL